MTASFNCDDRFPRDGPGVLDVAAELRLHPQQVAARRALQPGGELYNRCVSRRHAELLRMRGVHRDAIRSSQLQVQRAVAGSVRAARVSSPGILVTSGCMFRALRRARRSSVPTQPSRAVAVKYATRSEHRCPDNDPRPVVASAAPAPGAGITAT